MVSNQLGHNELQSVFLLDNSEKEVLTLNTRVELVKFT